MRFGLLLLAAIILATPTWAAIVIDQDAPTDNALMATFAQTDLAQSFQHQGPDHNIAGAGVLLHSAGAADNITIELWDALPNGGGVLLASGTALGTPGSYVDVSWAPVVITSGVDYFLVFLDGGASGMGLRGDTTNQYAFGNVFANPGFTAFLTFDYTFRTFTDDAFGVPEPTTLSLVGLGALALLGRRRRN